MYGFISGLSVLFLWSLCLFFMPVSCCFDYCSLAIYFEIRKCDSYFSGLLWLFGVLNLLRFVLRPNVFYPGEGSVYTREECVFFYSWMLTTVYVCYVSLVYSVLKSAVSFWIFCLDGLCTIISRSLLLLKSPTIIVLLSVSAFRSVNIFSNLIDVLLTNKNFVYLRHTT